jgi:hypothetical protein
VAAVAEAEAEEEAGIHCEVVAAPGEPGSGRATFGIDPCQVDPPFVTVLDFPVKVGVEVMREFCEVEFTATRASKRGEFRPGRGAEWVR